MRITFFICICISQCIFAQDISKELASRRLKLMKKLSHESVLFLFSAPVRNKNSDIDYEYRPSSNMYYLTGISQPETILVLLPESKQAFLFILERILEKEIWEGLRLSKAQARKISGIEEIYTTKEFSPFVDALFKKNPQILSTYLHPKKCPTFLTQSELTLFLELENGNWPHREPHTRILQRTLRKYFSGMKKELITTINCAPLLASLRLIKSKYEIECIKKAIKITELGLTKTLKIVRPLHYEYEIEAVIEYFYKKNNADWAFPSIVASGPNAAILHYTSSQRQTQKGEILLMDVGAAYNNYSADITRTIPVSGTFTSQQKKIYNLVLKAQQAAIKKAIPGNSISDLYEVAAEVIEDGLYQQGLITAKNKGQHRLYFMHGLCHWLGLDTHDVGSYRSILQPGMVFTIEPGIYISPMVLDRAYKRFGPKLVAKISPKVKEYINISVRIEDDFLLTKKGVVVLSNGVPRTVEEIEAAMAKNKR